MRDALGQELKLGQRVAIPKNSRFAIGILYNYRPNRGKHYLAMVQYVEDRAKGIPDPQGENNWRRHWYSQAKVDAQANKYYIRFPDGKTRVVLERLSIIGLSDDVDIIV